MKSNRLPRTVPQLASLAPPGVSGIGPDEGTVNFRLPSGHALGPLDCLCRKTLQCRHAHSVNIAGPDGVGLFPASRLRRTWATGVAG